MNRKCRKYLSVGLIAVMVIMTANPVSVKAELVSYVYEKLNSVFTTEAIEVDGIADDAYINAPLSSINNAKSGTNPTDFQAVSGSAIQATTGSAIRSVWDGMTLYLLVDVDDVTPAYETTPGVTSARSAGGFSWATWSMLPDTYTREDGVEFSIDFWNDKSGKFEDDDGLFTITRAGQLTYMEDSGVINHSSAYVQESNREYTNRIKSYAVKERADGSGYTVELALQIYGAALQNGTNFGVDVMIGDSPANSSARELRTYWSHSLNSVSFSSKDFNCDWGEITLTGWNGTDAFALNDWKLTNQLRYIDSVSFVKGVWTAASQAELDAAVAIARSTVGSTNQVEIDNASSKLATAIANLRWADTKYPDPMELESELTLPNIYEFFNGTKVTSTVDWEARRAEILDLAQFYEYGYKPASPDSITLGEIVFKPASTTWYGSTTPAYYAVPVNVTYGTQTQTITYKLTLPTEAERATVNKTGVALPVMLSFGAGSTNYHTAGIATLEIPTDVTSDDRNDPWNNTSLGGNRAGTLRAFFPYTRNGDTNEISNEMLAALGASIGIDALELLVENNVSIADLGNAAELINPSSLAVTGFSINGKYAFVSAVFDNRIDICVPGAAGATGPAVYRYDMNRITGNVYTWGTMTDGEVLGDTIRHNPGRTTELFRRFLTPGNFYYKIPGSYGYADRLPYDQEELVASLVLNADSDTSGKPRAIVLQHTIDDNGNQSQGDALSLEIAKTVYTWLGYDADDYVKFCFRDSGGHGTSASQEVQIAEYINWYFFDDEMTQETATNLNRNPFYEDTIDGVDGWTRNYGGYEAIAPWINSMKPSITSMKAIVDHNKCYVTVIGNNLLDTKRSVTFYLNDVEVGKSTLLSSDGSDTWTAQLDLPLGSYVNETVLVTLDMENNYDIDLNLTQKLIIINRVIEIPGSTPIINIPTDVPKDITNDTSIKEPDVETVEEVTVTPIEETIITPAEETDPEPVNNLITEIPELVEEEQEAVVDIIDIPQSEIPEADTLPQTGTTMPVIYVIVGSLCLLLGALSLWYQKKKKLN